jgi:hypothetical protein
MQKHFGEKLIFCSILKKVTGSGSVPVIQLQVRIRGSGSVSKRHGSRTLPTMRFGTPSNPLWKAYKLQTKKKIGEFYTFPLFTLRIRSASLIDAGIPTEFFIRLDIPLSPSSLSYLRSLLSPSPSQYSSPFPSPFVLKRMKLSHTEQVGPPRCLLLKKSPINFAWLQRKQKSMFKI